MLCSVRSLASVAYKMSQDKDQPRLFDFFSLDFAEDLGALYGPALEVRQATVNPNLHAVIYTGVAQLCILPQHTPH